MRKIIFGILLVALAALSCTRVNENVYDKYPAAQFYATPTGVNDALAGEAIMPAGITAGMISTPFHLTSRLFLTVIQAIGSLTLRNCIPIRNYPVSASLIIPGTGYIPACIAQILPWHS
jgi:hypothetical protein